MTVDNKDDAFARSRSNAGLAATLTGDIMAKLLIPPPSIEDFISYFVKWIAKNMRARVTIKVYWNDDKHFTEEYDGRF